MKKRVIALGVAAAFGALAASTASAQVGGELVFNPQGVGHILIVPYFSTQSGNATLLNLYNTDEKNGKAVKIRFRGASNSDDIFDFQVFLSPGDVWTADIRQASSGVSRLATSDNSCTVPAREVINREFVLDRLNGELSGDELANESREGYVEILNMGDIVQGDTADPGYTKSLFYITKHNSDGVAPCTRTILDSLSITDSRLSAPTTGLMANWTIINVPNTTVWSGEAAAIEARSAGVAIPGANVYWPQQALDVEAPDVLAFTADPLFLGDYLTAQQYDLPDLSTPYIPGACAAECAQVQANALSAAMAATRIAGEYLSSSTISASTDWVISKPTRRYYVAVDYDGETPADKLVTNYNDNSVDIAVYYTNSNMSMGSASNGGKSYQACTQVGTPSWYNREEKKPAPGGPVVSPGPREQPPFLCGEVSVVGVNSPTSAIGASVARVNVTLPSGFTDGWGAVPTSGNSLCGDGGTQSCGLPVLATQFSKATNPQVSAGVSGTFGASYPARVLSRGALPPQPPQ